MGLASSLGLHGGATDAAGNAYVTTNAAPNAGPAAPSRVDATVAGDGAVLWTHSSGANATVAGDGTVVSFGPSQGIMAIDGATGATRWQLPLPVDTCITDAALTSAGGLVALQRDGTLFGASDGDVRSVGWPSRRARR